MTSCTIFFQAVVFPLSSFVSKFHFNIITRSGITTIFVYKGFTRYLEIGNNHVHIFPYHMGQRKASDSKFDTNISNKKLLNATKWLQL